MQQTCRYAADPVKFPGHHCVNRDGERVRGEQVCWFEARSQVLDGERRRDACDAADRAWDRRP